MKIIKETPDYLRVQICAPHERYPNDPGYVRKERKFLCIGGRAWASASQQTTYTIMDTHITANLNSFAEFKAFPKLARLSREVIVTEKIDGTNAQIYIEVTTPQIAASFPNVLAYQENALDGTALAMLVGSRSRWITRKTDNHGFAKWAEENQTELFKFGQGRHFGEWWGSGIQRGYGLPQGEKRFSLFNVDRWIDTHIPLNCGEDLLEKGKVELAPKCCHVVPILWRGNMDDLGARIIGEKETRLDKVSRQLEENGSVASPGFLKPEGVVIFHVAGNVGFKKTLEKDELPKGLA